MAQINIRVDDALKEKADVLFNSLGMTLTSAVNIFISQAVREGGLPFAVTTRTGNDSFYSSESTGRLKESIGGMNHREPLDD